MKEFKKNVDIIEKYCNNLKHKNGLTTHIYVNDFDKEIYETIQELILSKPVMDHINSKYNKNNDNKILPINEMNELYISDLNSKGSDNVFINKHIDGPFMFIPGCKCIRLLLGLKGNKNIETVFVSERKKNVLEKYDILSFDYNRDLHYIRNNNLNDDNNNRIILKLHYAIIPKWMDNFSDTFKNLNSNYNTWARNNFLYSQNPKTLSEKVISFNINAVTNINAFTVEYIGWHNIIILILMLIYFIFNKNIKHYSYIFVIFAFIYIFQFIFRQVNIDDFAADTRIYKSLFILYFLYLLSIHKLDYIILTIILIIISISIHITSYLALDKDLTYFGKELGVVKEYKIINKFPYNVINHPMIVATILSLIALSINKNIFNDNKIIILIVGIIYLSFIFLEKYDFHNTESFTECYEKFKKYHDNKNNINIHLFTTILGLFALINLLYLNININKKFLFFIINIYSYFFFKYSVNEHITHLSQIFVFIISLIALIYNLCLNKKFIFLKSSIFFIALLLVSIVLQELSHKYYNEDTFMNNYDNKNNIILHSIWLIPLVLKRFYDN